MVELGDLRTSVTEVNAAVLGAVSAACWEDVGLAERLFGLSRRVCVAAGALTPARIQRLCELGTPLFVVLHGGNVGYWSSEEGAGALAPAAGLNEELAQQIQMANEAIVFLLYSICRTRHPSTILVAAMFGLSERVVQWLSSISAAQFHQLSRAQAPLFTLLPSPHGRLWTRCFATSEDAETNEIEVLRTAAFQHVSNVPATAAV